MGNLCCLKSKNQKKITLLLVGLDNAGKTVAARNLAGEPADSVVPTVGFSIVNLSYQGFQVVLFDLGGGSDIRGIWDEYFVYAHGVIFVVDSSDYKRLDEAKIVLQDLLSHKKISGKPVLLLANKQDDENALDEIDLVEKLQLEYLVNNNQCPTLVETCCAGESQSKSNLDPGIKNGYRWLMNYIIRDYDVINKRVEIDVLEQEEQERKARLETIERIRILNEKEQKCRRDDDIIELYSEYQKQNGTSQQSENELLQLQRREAGSDSSSACSNESLPHIYHVQSSNENKEERPKSAVQLVKQQIELENTRKGSLKAFISNKTAPVSLYGVKLPHSASERRTAMANARRTLKSAGDSIFIVSDMLNTINVTSHGDAPQRELFQLNNFERKQKLPPLRLQLKHNQQNGAAINHSSVEENGISIIEVD